MAAETNAVTTRQSGPTRQSAAAGVNKGGTVKPAEKSGVDTPAGP